MKNFELINDSAKAKEVSEATYAALHQFAARIVSTASILVRVLAVAGVYYASKFYLKDIRIVGFLTIMTFAFIVIDEFQN